MSILKNVKFDVKELVTYPVTGSYTVPTTEPEHKSRKIYCFNWNDLPKIISAITNIVDNLNGDEKVYFDKGVTLLREDFRRTFPNAKIKRKIEDADVVVLEDLQYSLYKSQTLYVSKYSSTKYVHDWTYKDNKLSWNTYYYLEEPIYKLVTKGDKKVILTKDLLKNTAKGEELNFEMFQNLIRMLNSTNRDDAQFGLQLLTALDFNKYKTEIAYLFYKTEWKQRGARLNVQTKALFNHLDVRSEYELPEYDILVTKFLSSDVDKNKENIKKVIFEKLEQFTSFLDIEINFKAKSKYEETSTQS